MFQPVSLNFVKMVIASTPIRANTKMADLGGRTMLPGVVDSHGHMVGGGLQALSANMLPPPDGSGPHPGENRSLRLRTAAAFPWISTVEIRDSVLTVSEGPGRPPVVIDLPQAIDAAGNNHAPRMLVRDVDNLKRNSKYE